ncbi:hypothetical protein GWI33_000631 [Rhynchophorus ferrugineus]|uniref:Uncharacterized protein n=1 Tax=Rhynchophorus ferrugineus TaxID=354439 RepID=A0A834IQY4_RHYFE|nr:hypothetical protein GWI33_000631 [Rhynchophorus ferrugineus]
MRASLNVIPRAEEPEEENDIRARTKPPQARHQSRATPPTDMPAHQPREHKPISSNIAKPPATTAVPADSDSCARFVTHPEERRRPPCSSSSSSSSSLPSPSPQCSDPHYFRTVFSLSARPESAYSSSSCSNRSPAGYVRQFVEDGYQPEIGILARGLGPASKGRLNAVDTTIAGLAEPHQRDGAPRGQALDAQGWPRAMARLQPDTTDCDNDGTVFSANSSCWSNATRWQLPGRCQRFRHIGLLQRQLRQTRKTQLWR